MAVATGTGWGRGRPALGRQAKAERGAAAPAVLAVRMKVARASHQAKGGAGVYVAVTTYTGVRDNE